MSVEGRGVVLSPGEALVLESSGGVYRIRLADGREVEATLRGRLRKESRTGGRVVPGDRVVAEPVLDDPRFTIEQVLPRRNELVRSGPGGRGARIVAANLDRCVVVLSAADPPFDPDVADRFLVLAESCGIPALLVLNKTDLPEAEEVARVASRRYGAIGYRVLPTSVPGREGLEELRRVLREGLSVVIGPSGVGKSSLLNAVHPGMRLRTAEVSARTGRGRHTTVSACLVELPGGGWVVDTPGFSDVRLHGVARSELGETFPEFRGPSERCRFRGCSHLHEPDCGVREALAAGLIAPERYESYRRLCDDD